jgi:hypothetical protein
MKMSACLNTFTILYVLNICSNPVMFDIIRFLSASMYSYINFKEVVRFSHDSKKYFGLISHCGKILKCNSLPVLITREIVIKQWYKIVITISCVMRPF